MLNFRVALVFALSGFGLSACAYTPEAAEPRWTDAQLAAAPPSQAPGYVGETPLPAGVMATLVAREERLLERRDEIQAEAGEIPEPDGETEDFAAEARERGAPPNPN